MLSFLKGDVLYIQIFMNRFRIRNVTAGKDLDLPSTTPFSHSRTILATFSVAEEVLRQGIKGFHGLISPSMLLHPMEKIDGGLTQIEERALLELGYGSGAGRVGIWTGRPLKDEEVTAKIAELRPGRR